MKQTPDSIDELAHAILHHKELYYGGRPEISDAEFDALEDKLRDLDPTHPALDVVGGEVKTGQKVEHSHPMLSLAKTYSEEDLLSWCAEHDVMGTLKVDGNSLSLVYQNGRLYVAKTRGNGRVGEDVTEKAKWVSDCRYALKGEESYEIRGELFCSDSQFIRLSHEMEKLDLEPPTNPRNIVAGILGRKQHVTLARFFSFAAFDVLDESGASPFATETDKVAWLEKNGFNTPHSSILKNEEQVLEFLEYGRKMMDEGEMAIDGVVFAYNDVTLHRELGSTAHHPRFKMSFKWQGAVAEATIDEIIWQTSRLGVVTPVAKIEPVELSGATITNVTLHHAEHVRLFNLKHGDVIEIVRSGEVIPKFLRVLKEASGKIHWPDHCPSCGEGLHFDEVRLVCENKEGCPAQQIGRILNWIRCAEIDDLSEKRLEPLMSLGMVREIPDLYQLGVNDLLKLPLTKEKMANKLYSNIQASKKIPLASFLNGLGIQGMGRTSWENLLKVFPGLKELKKTSSEEIAEVDGFAEKTAEGIVNGLKEKGSLIDGLLKVGVDPVYKIEANSGIFDGMTIAITGSFSRPRSELQNLIKKEGGKPTSSVSAKTTMLLIADPDSTSSKAKKAREAGVKLIGEEDFFVMIDQ